MPRIFDNIEQRLLPALAETLEVSERADFCVGYFNLRGWRKIDSFIDQWSGGEGNCCRLLVGMQRQPEEEMRSAFGLIDNELFIDNKTIISLKKKLAEDFRDQLMLGIPTNQDETGLRKLAKQIQENKVVVKLYLRHPLHAKLYLLFRTDPNNPTTGYLGSSNLTTAGLSQQGELNIDVLDHDACNKLAKWFDDRWTDKYCVDISEELVKIIDESWAREDIIPPYYIYVKMAYHLSQEAIHGIREFRIPKIFGKRLFDYQEKAVQIAAHHVNKRNGVIIGDVVGLGKTLMATAVAKIFDDDQSMQTLIISPKNLVEMWKEYRFRYELHAEIISITEVIKILPDMRRYKLMVIDESHNLRNREGKRYRAILEYIRANESKCILLSATPYNKTYLDLSNQIRLFIDEGMDLGIRPERLIREKSEIELQRMQCPPRSLLAFEKSEYPEDWRELMRLYMVRRTRSFIKENYATTDPENDRKYLTYEDGQRSYFPDRIPKTIKFNIDNNNPEDQYAKLYSDEVLTVINSLDLPRYGLANYLSPNPENPPVSKETTILNDLSRAGKRLMGFSRTNLFKRLESNGFVFIQSIERHILRNFIFIHALENKLSLPIGTQDASYFDSRFEDRDETEVIADMFEEESEETIETISTELSSEDEFRERAKEVYESYSDKYHKRFRWIRSDLFIRKLKRHLLDDSRALMKVLNQVRDWNPEKDEKLKELYDLISKKHSKEKIIVFTQYADTVNYLVNHLKNKGIQKLEGVTGDSADPTAFAYKFSPVSNEKRDKIQESEELRVLIATDVLSEGQNLQDCAIVVNFDLPWAIIRLVQRAGRVDRIGQKAENIMCYSFLPAEGVEKIIKLRARVRQRLSENAEVVGSDESFFEDDKNDQAIRDLYSEKAGIMDGDDDTEVDLASYAYEIWNKATEADPKLKTIIPKMPDVCFSTKSHFPQEYKPEGVLVYVKTGEGNDSLAWVDNNGKTVTESQLAIINAAACSPETEGFERAEKHHELVKKGVEYILEEEKQIGGQLGRPSGARFRTYERLKNYADSVKDELFDTRELRFAVDDIYKFPLRQTAIDTLNRQLKSGISDQVLAELVIALRKEDRLCIMHEKEQTQEPRIICSMGLKKTK